MLFRVFVLYCTDWPDCWLLGRRRRRLPSRRGWQEAVSLGDPGEPVALPGGVIRRLCAAVELARSIQGLLIGEGRQPVRLAAFLSLGQRLLFGLLGFNGRDLPAAGSRLRGLAVVVALLLSPAGVRCRSSWSMRSYFASRANLNFRLYGGVGRSVLVRYDQQLVEGFWLVAEELVLEEGAFSAPGCEVLDGLHLVHALAGVPKLAPACEVVAR